MSNAANTHCPYTQNRELSWLRFDQRVLEEAADPAVPPLERLKFVSIFTSNLDGWAACSTLPACPPRSGTARRA